MQGDQQELEKHFCSRIFPDGPYRLAERLESRFAIPFSVRFLWHGDGECLFVQRIDTKKLMRFYRDELIDWTVAPWERLQQRIAHRIENGQFDNGT